jgi:asparagine synthase (glutamine-hydrolysing)
MFDEPFADSSQIPTFLVAQLARREVTVALSGDGGDELFAGYNRHQWNRRLWRRLQWLPAATRSLAARGMAAVPARSWDRLLASVARPLGVQHPGGSMHKLASVLGASDPDELYARLVSKWDPAEAIVRGGRQLPSALDDGRAAFLSDMTERMMVVDMMTYLPDDILVKVDRASMAVSLESRVPLIDHRVVELALRLPLALKLRDGTGKWILRQVLDRYVPRSLVERPKSGFAIPLAAWLRGPLRGWAEELLDENRLVREGWLDAGRVRQQWRQHLRGAGDHEHRLWTVLMFQAWLEHQ